MLFFSRKKMSFFLLLGKKKMFAEHKPVYRSAIEDLLQDPSYSKTASHYGAILRDEQETPLERAVFHIEYLIRHQGAPFLRSAR